ncbi:nuclear transport factor 2 family protein [Lacrimispora brassicae]
MNKAFLVNFLDRYNECFYNKDIEGLRDFYDTEGNVLIYFDNHEGNDTYNLEEHLELISEFFAKGKVTESGGVEPLIIEKLNIFHKESTACLCFISKYKSFPIPAVRSTLYLEKSNDIWKIVHAHFSFEPVK